MPVSIAQLCNIGGLPRSSFYHERGKRSRKWECDHDLEARIKATIDNNPSWGLRMITAHIRSETSKPINRKKIHRIMKHNGWQAYKRPIGNRPRAKGMVSRVDTINTRWAIDATHIMCGQDGWCHLTAVIDCCNREIVGYRFSRRGIARIAAGALEDGLVYRKITKGQTVALRSDNGLVFGSKEFVGVVKKYGLDQEYITPYTPEQNGMIERFFRTLKEECVWLNRFKSLEQAQKIVDEWIHKYNTQRPHSALGYRAPAAYPSDLAA